MHCWHWWSPVLVLWVFRHLPQVQWGCDPLNFLIQSWWAENWTVVNILNNRLRTEVLTFWPHLKVTSLTLGWKFYLHFVLLVIPVDLICQMTMFEFFLTPPWYPKASKVPPLGHDQGDRILSDIFCICHLWEHTQSLVKKIFEIEILTKI